MKPRKLDLTLFSLMVISIHLEGHRNETLDQTGSIVTFSRFQIWILFFVVTLSRFHFHFVATLCLLGKFTEVCVVETF